MHVTQKKKKQDSLYYQSQSNYSIQCGVHCINNLLGTNKCSNEALNEICRILSSNFINPHKSIFGGDYDANVLIYYLQKQKYQCQWFDNRQKIIFKQKHKDKKFIGFILNECLQKKFYHTVLGLSSRHWIAVRLIEDKYYYLDSSKKQELSFHQKQLQIFLKKKIQKQSILIKVFQKQSSKQQILDYNYTIQTLQIDKQSGVQQQVYNQLTLNSMLSLKQDPMKQLQKQKSSVQTKTIKPSAQIFEE